MTGSQTPQACRPSHIVFRLIAIAYPTAIAGAAYLALGAGWPWYEWVLAGFGLLWAIPVVWGGWVASRAFAES